MVRVGWRYLTSYESRKGANRGLTLGSPLFRVFAARSALMGWSAFQYSKPLTCLDFRKAGERLLSIDDCARSCFIWVGFRSVFAMVTGARMARTEHTCGPL